MKTIISFNINGSKNEVCNAFANLMVPHVKSCEVITRNFAPQVDELERTAKKFADCLLNHRFSELTENVQTLDTRRDRKWTAARMVIVSELESLDPAHKHAAEVINKLFDSFGKIRTMGYAEQSGAMDSLCADLLQNHAADLQILGLVPLIEDLQEANKDFCQAYEERTELMADHEKGETRDAKQAFCFAYRTLIFLVNAYILQNGSDGLDDFIAYANTLIRQYRQIIGQKPAPDKDESFDEGLEDEEQEDDLGDAGNGGTLPPSTNPTNPPAGGNGGNNTDDENTGGDNNTDNENTGDNNTENTETPGGNTGNNTGNNTGDNTGGGSAQKYTVTYWHNGAVYTTQEVEAGQRIQLPAAPEGYRWTNIPPQMPAQNITITSQEIGPDDF